MKNPNLPAPIAVKKDKKARVNARKGIAANAKEEIDRQLKSLKENRRLLKKI